MTLEAADGTKLAATLLRRRPARPRNPAPPPVQPRPFGLARPGGEPRPRRLPRARARLPRLRRQRREAARHADGPGARPGRDRGLAGRRRRRLRLPARPARSPERFGRRRRELRRQPVDPALAAPPGGQVARPSLGNHRPRGPEAPAQQGFAAAHARGLGRRRRRGRVHDVDRRVLGQSRPTVSSSTRPAATAPTSSGRTRSFRARSSRGTTPRSPARESRRPPTIERARELPRVRLLMMTDEPGGFARVAGTLNAERKTDAEVADPRRRVS